MYAAFNSLSFMSVCATWCMHVLFTYLLSEQVHYAYNPIITLKIRFHYTLVCRRVGSSIQKKNWHWFSSYVFLMIATALLYNKVLEWTPTFPACLHPHVGSPSAALREIEKSLGWHHSYHDCALSYHTAAPGVWSSKQMRKGCTSVLPLWTCFFVHFFLNLSPHISM